MSDQKNVYRIYKKLVWAIQNSGDQDPAQAAEGLAAAVSCGQCLLEWFQATGYSGFMMGPPGQEFEVTPGMIRSMITIVKQATAQRAQDPIFDAALKAYPENVIAQQYLPEAAQAFNEGDYGGAVASIEAIQCHFNQPSAVWAMLITYIQSRSDQAMGI